MAELALTPTEHGISVGNGYPPPESLVGVEAPLVRYLLEQLIAQRLENAQLHADLAAAAQRGRIEKAAREREAAPAWIVGLNDEFGQTEAQPASVNVIRASGAGLLREARAREASAQVPNQFAVMKTKLKELERHMATVQSVAERLAERLGVAEADLKLRHDENKRLTGELDTLCISTQDAALLAPMNAAPTEDAMETLHAWQKPAGLLSATSLEVAPTMPHPKPRIRASNLEAWTRADVAVPDKGPTTDTTRSAASESSVRRNMMSEAALEPNSFVSRTLVRSESGSTSLDGAAARLADALKATRKEAMIQQQERVFSVDVNKRAFASSGGEFVPLDPALDINLLTAKSELVGGSTGGIRFFPNGSSTGGQIELWLLGNRTAVNVQWSTGAVTLER